MTDPLDRLKAQSTETPTPEFAASLRRRITAIEDRTVTSKNVTSKNVTSKNVTTASSEQAGWHLAQLNLGLFAAPLDAPEMQPFVASLDRINAIADASPGFVWRLTGDDGAPSSYVEVPGVDDPLIASNLSVWTDLEALRNFMYKSDHVSYLRRRAEWFQHVDIPMTVGWWIPAGILPTLEEALARLDQLRADGPSNDAFPLGRTIPPAPATPPTSTTSKETTMSALPSAMIPYLTVGDAKAALQFYEEIFGAVRTGETFEMDDGRLGHAEFNIGDQRFYLADEFPEMNLRTPSAVGSNSVSLVLAVDDCDAVYEHAIEAGATGERAPANQHGFRSGWFVDPWGHRWSPTSAVI